VMNQLRRLGRADPSTYPYFMDGDLVYYLDPVDARRRLCVPKSLEKEVFMMAHDEHHRAGFHRAYNSIVTSLYIRNLSRRLKQYITHCPKCLHYQTVRHAPYGALQPIVGPPIPFHTVTADFILGLPKTSTGLDASMTVTCKFSKKVEFIPGKETWTAIDWAKAYFAATTDWSIPSVWIGDRDSKWLSEFWTQLFSDMGARISTTTAYHPQSDGQSERTNQTAEIALRYDLELNPDTDFTEFLPAFKRVFNNSVNASTGRSPNQIIYGFNLADSFGVVTEGDAKDFEAERKVHQQEAQDSIAWANLAMKKRYDKRHTPLLLNPGDLVTLKLHHGYRIPGIKNKKLSIQRVGRFKIKRRVSPLAYELELPPNMKIHPVISVTNIEPLPPGEDPYKRPFNDHPPPVEDDQDIDEEWKSFSIEKLLDRRLRRYGRGEKIIEYLVKWEGYGPEFNEWYGEDLLGNAVELMLEYERRQNNDPERIDYLRKQLAGENTELPVDSTRPPPKKSGRKPKNKNKK
jgi:transposase InsO family protein